MNSIEGTEEKRKFSWYLINLAIHLVPLISCIQFFNWRNFILNGQKKRWNRQKQSWAQMIELTKRHQRVTILNYGIKNILHLHWNFLIKNANYWWNSFKWKCFYIFNCVVVRILFKKRWKKMNIVYWMVMVNNWATL